MKARTAFLLRFLLPPLYPALTLTLLSFIFDGTGDGGLLPLLGFFTLWAYLLAGLPALAFAVVMTRSDKRASPASALANATLIGGASGAFIGAVFWHLGVVAVLLCVGLVTGFLVEGTVLLLRRRSLRTSHTRALT